MKKKDDLIREFLDGAQSEVIRLLTEARVVGMEMEKTHKENKNGR